MKRGRQALRDSFLEWLHAYEPSRLFDDASTEYLRVGSTPLTGTPLSMACWFCADADAVTLVLIHIADTAAYRGYYMRLRGTVAGDPVEIDTHTTSAAFARTTTGYTVGAWHHAVGVVASPTLRSVYIDTGSKGTNETLRDDPTITCVNVGRLEANTNYMSGRIAWPCVWNVALADAEIAALGNRQHLTPPWEVRPESIVSMPSMRTLYDPYMKAHWTTS